MKLAKDEQKLILKVAKGYLLAKEFVGLPTATIKAAQQLVLAAEAAELDVPWAERAREMLADKRCMTCKVNGVKECTHTGA